MRPAFSNPWKVRSRKSRSVMWQGTYTAIVTPFNRDGGVDYGKLAALV